MCTLFFKTTWAVLNVCILFRKAKSVKCLIYFLCIHAVYMSFQPRSMLSQCMYPSLGSRILKPALDLSYPHFGNDNYIVQFIQKTVLKKYRIKAYACPTTFSSIFKTATLRNSGNTWYNM